jgi:hypothetical protein
LHFEGGGYQESGYHATFQRSSGFLFVFRRDFVAEAGLELAMSSFSLQSAGIIDVCHHDLNSSVFNQFALVEILS